VPKYRTNYRTCQIPYQLPYLSNTVPVKYRTRGSLYPKCRTQNTVPKYRTRGSLCARGSLCGWKKAFTVYGISCYYVLNHDPVIVKYVENYCV
jgi:hypothetical protein